MLWFYKGNDKYHDLMFDNTHPKKVFVTDDEILFIIYTNQVKIYFF